jgi:hypothetical protein
MAEIGSGQGDALTPRCGDALVSVPSGRGQGRYSASWDRTG